MLIFDNLSDINKHAENYERTFCVLRKIYLYNVLSQGDRFCSFVYLGM